MVIFNRKHLNKLTSEGFRFVKLEYTYLKKKNDHHVYLLHPYRTEEAALEFSKEKDDTIFDLQDTTILDTLIHGVDGIDFVIMDSYIASS